MRIAFTATGNTWDSLIDPRFGRTAFIVITDEQTREFLSVDNNDSRNEAHGAGTATAQKLSALKPDVLITGNGPGVSAFSALKQMNIKIYVDAHNLTVREAYARYKEGRLSVMAEQ